MRITLNGAEVDLDATTLEDLDAGPGTAVALNDEVVPREQHPATALTEGDVVEIVTAVQGG